MDFVIVIIMAAVFIIAALSNKVQAASISLCKLHTWTIDHNGEYFCRVCRKSPTQIGTDYDKPY